MRRLIDSHVHALSAGLSEFRGKIPPLRSFEDIRSFVRDQAKMKPKGACCVFRTTFDGHAFRGWFVRHPGRA